MTEPRTSLPTPAPEGAPPAAPKRSAVPAAPPERRTTEIDKQRVPMAAKPYRLLALVKQDAVVRVQKEPDDTVLTWPHLLSIELFAAAIDRASSCCSWACSSTRRWKSSPTAT